MDSGKKLLNIKLHEQNSCYAFSWNVQMLQFHLGCNFVDMNSIHKHITLDLCEFRCCLKLVRWRYPRKLNHHKIKSFRLSQFKMMIINISNIVEKHLENQYLNISFPQYDKLYYLLWMTEHRNRNITSNMIAVKIRTKLLISALSDKKIKLPWDIIQYRLIIMTMIMFLYGWSSCKLYLPLLEISPFLILLVVVPPFLGLIFPEQGDFEIVAVLRSDVDSNVEFESSIVV